MASQTKRCKHNTERPTVPPESLTSLPLLSSSISLVAFQLKKKNSVQKISLVAFIVERIEYIKGRWVHIIIYGMNDRSWVVVFVKLKF